MAKRHRHSDPTLSAELLGYHLGIADDETRTRVEAAFDDAEDLARARERLRKILAPLDLDETPTPPADLVANVLKRVAGAGKILPMPQPAERPATTAKPAASHPVPALARGQDRSPTSRPFLALRELVGLAAAILMFVGILVPGYRTSRMAAQRAACANNLRMIGNAYASYAENNNRYLPFVTAVPPGAAWSSPMNAGVPRARNSQNVWRLVRGRYVTPEKFNCEAREGDIRLSTIAPQDFDDFPDPRNNSYSTHFITRPWRQQELLAETPLASDPTPLVDQQRRLIPLSRVSINSDSHGKSRGQNVLRVNLSVRFFKNPHVGVEKDDIYRVFGVERYTGMERPSLKSDAFLIP